MATIGAPMELISGVPILDGMFGAMVTEVTIWLDGSLMVKGLGAMALGIDCWRFCAATEREAC